MRSLLIGIALFTAIAASSAFAQSPYGSGPEAKALLERAVTALRADPAAAIARFNRADGGFRDRDLYVACFEMGTGTVRAHVDPKQLGVDVRAMKQADGRPFGQEIFNAARPGTIATVDYLFPKPGTTAPVAKQSYVTRVGNHACLVGYYK
jgi:cytochrome c